MGEKMELNFIDGEFKTKEAKELLMDLFTKKIQFHEMKNFSKLVRFGNEDFNSKARTSSLKESIELLSDFLEKHDNDKVRLYIHSEIRIEVKND